MILQVNISNLLAGNLEQKLILLALLGWYEGNVQEGQDQRMHILPEYFNVRDSEERELDAALQQPFNEESDLST